MTRISGPRIVAAAIGALAIGSSLSARAEVSAKPTTEPWAGCDRGEFCIYEHPDGTGYYASMQRGTGNLNAREVFGARLNDKVSAVWNRDDKPWCLYEHADTRWNRGHKLMVPSGFKGRIDRKRTRDGFRWNNQASGVRKAQLVTPLFSAAHYECGP
jgi:hypothetical protein